MTKLPQLNNDNARKRWIYYGLLPRGKLYLDRGAVKAISQKGKSLLPAGIIKVEGEFDSLEAVQLYNESGQEIGRGIVNYNQEEIDKIKGNHSDKIPELLGYHGAETIVHRDNLVIN